MIGHNNPPRDRTIKKRWARALFSHPDKPAGAIAMGFKIYMEMDSAGCGAVISDREFADCCGISERAVQNFKRWLLNAGFVRIQVKGARGRANAFIARIPGEQMTAPDAAIQDQIAARITGKDGECQHPLPARPHQMPATYAVNEQMTAPDAGNASASCAPRACMESSLREDTPSLEVVVVEEATITAANSVRVNCETITGPGFVIDLRGVDLAAGSLGIDLAEAKCLAEQMARDWAVNGRIPHSPMSMIRKALNTMRHVKLAEPVQKTLKSALVAQREKIRREHGWTEEAS